MDITINQLYPLNLESSANSPFWNEDHLFKTGEKIHVTGASGSGKTTLFSVIYGLTREYRGKIAFQARDITDFTREKWAALRRTKLSMVFQQLRLFEDLSGLENILIKGQLTDTVEKSSVLMLAQRLGMEELLEKPVKRMSLGERQRISIARALVQPFAWLLLDEPFSHLDTANTAKACRLIEEICEKNRAGMIMANHEKDHYFQYQQEVVL